MFTAGGSHARLPCRQGADLQTDVVCKLVPFYALEARIEVPESQHVNGK